MSTSPHRPLWQRLFRSPETRLEQDAADMGTAMGLDFVLDEPPLPTAVTTRRQAPTEIAQAPRYVD